MTMAQGAEAAAGERRYHARLEVYAPLFLVFRHADHDGLPCLARNLSPRGIMLEFSPLARPTGAEVGEECVLEPAPGQPAGLFASLRGSVAWKAGCHLGVEASEPLAGDTEELSAWLRGNGLC